MALISSRTLTTNAFPLPYLINSDNPTLEYSRYLMDAPKKTDVKNQPTKFEFSLVPIDDAFIKLKRGNYICMQTAKYPNWFTGYVINDPQLTALGTRGGVTLYGYSYVAMSDEYLVNLKPLGIRKPFLNMSQGKILKALVEDLCPGMYDLSAIQDGIQLPRYQVDPNVKFVDIVKDFCSSACFTFFGNAGKLSFIPADTTDFSLTIDGADKNFTPSLLTLTPSSDPIINDVTVLGKIEPQNHMTEYFAGDGFTGAYPLAASPFGVDSTVILQDTFTSNGLDSSKWTLYDDPASFIKVSGGYVNVEGGLNNNSYDVHIDSAMPVPIEGQLRMTNGEWDFLPVNTLTAGMKAIICGLWTQEPSQGQDVDHYPGLVYGLRIYQQYANNVLLCHPVINGFADNNQYIALNTASRYVIRTNYDCALSYRTSTSTSYVDVDGTIQTIVTPDPVIHDPVTGVTSTPTNPTGISFQTLLSEINVDSGNLVRQDIFTNEVADISTTPSYALYIPVASNNLHATFTNITISVPIQGSLSVARASLPGETSLFDSPRVRPFVQQSLGQNELDSLDGEAPTATIADTNNGVTTASSLLGTPQYNSGAAALTFFKNSVALQSTTPEQGSLIKLSYKEAGAAVARTIDIDSINQEAASWKDDGIRAVVRTDVSPQPRTSEECELVSAALVGNNSYQHYEGTYTFNSDFLTANYQPISGAILKFRNLPYTFPSVYAEEVTQVVTTLDSKRPQERFTHVATFGVIDRVQQLLAAYYQPADQFIPLDTSITPISVPTSQVGLAFAPDVTTLEFDGMDSGLYRYVINEVPPITGGFEARLTDDGWGCDDGNNLVARIFYDPTVTQYFFNSLRDSRSKLIYVRAFDGRNLIPYSEDIEKWTAAGCTVVTSMAPDPSDNYSLISTITGQQSATSFELYIYTSNYTTTSYGTTSTYSMLPYGELDQPTKLTAGQYTFTTDVKAPLGKSFYIRIYDLNGTLTGQPYWFSDHYYLGTGSWQRVSVTATVPPHFGDYIIGVGILGVSGGGPFASTFQMTRASLEYGTPVETQYCKTNGRRYGVTSRFSTGLRVNFPFVPPPIKSVSVAYSGNLTDVNTITTGSGITQQISYLQQVDASGTPTQHDPTPTQPQITLTLPDEELDVFGVEIRDHDNSTVLYRQNLTTAAFSLAVSVHNAEGLSNLKYFVYTYNVFGEYSTHAQIVTSIFVPGITSVTVDYLAHLIEWTIDDPISGTNGYKFKVEIDTVSNAFANVFYSVSGIVGSSVNIPYFMNGNTVWIRVTPSNSFNSGASMSIQSSFNVLPIDEFDANFISVIVAP